MNTDRARLAEAALQHVGIPFRLHGRDPARGLDCIGLLVVSLKAIGVHTSDAAGYGLRNRTIEKHLAHLTQSGFSPASGAIEAGDVLLVRPGPGQHHILICDGSGGFVHAHAGLRRVVHSSCLSAWPVSGHYRLSLKHRG